MGAGMTSVEVTEDFAQDAHLFAAMLRAGGPVRRVRMPRGLDCYIVTDFAQARALLADPRLHKDNRRAYELFEAKLPAGATNQGGFGEALGRHMLNTDPPDHSRLRKLVNKAFTGRTVARLRPRIEEITAELLDALAGQERADLLPSFAAPLPITVICELLGVAPEDRNEFSALVQDAAELVGAGGRAGTRRRACSPTSPPWSSRSAPSRPRTCCRTWCTRATTATRCPSDELMSMAFLLLVAGHETTVNLIANSVLALLTAPDQLALLRADPSLMPGAVEEFLRFDGPIHLATLRFTAEPVEAGEVTIPEGEFVLISLLGANRDEERFPDAGRARRHAGGGRAPGVRPRHPLLRRRAPGPPGGRDRAGRPAGAVPGPRAGRQAGRAGLPAQLPDARAGGAAGPAALTS